MILRSLDIYHKYIEYDTISFQFTKTTKTKCIFDIVLDYIKDKEKSFSCPNLQDIILEILDMEISLERVELACSYTKITKTLTSSEGYYNY